METPSYFLDRAQLQLTLESLSPVSHALSELADATLNRGVHPIEGDENALPGYSSQRDSPPSSSAVQIARQLASIIRSPSNSSESITDSVHAHESDDLSRPTPSVLGLELATLVAIGFRAEVFLPPSSLRSICSTLSSSISTFAATHILHTINDPVIHALPSPAAARRAVFRLALSKRYGNLRDAPSAMAIAGAPYLLYVHQAMPPPDRVITPPVKKLEGAASKSTDSPESQRYTDWCLVTEGIAVLDHVAVPAEDVTRAAVAAKLRDAVSNRSLSPILMIVDAELDSTLSGAADVLRAVCDTYGLHMHVEGNALPLIIAGNASKNLLYNVGDLVSAAHTTTIEVAQWFGSYHTAVLLHWNSRVCGDQVRSSVGAPGDLSAFLSLWFLFHRMQLSRSAHLVRAACEHANTFTEYFCGITHLIECKTVGCGSSVVISYAAADADIKLRNTVNKAMLVYFTKCLGRMRGLLTIAGHGNQEWVLFSPSRILTLNGNIEPCSVQVVKDISEALIYACRRCELVVKGKARFMSEMRQCQDVEVEDLKSHRTEESFVPLFFAGIRVTPFGEVSRNGHWKKDEDMRARVKRFTLSLAGLLETHPCNEFESFVHDSDDVMEAPIVCIGPILPKSSTNEQATIARTGMSPDVDKDASPFEKGATFAERWNFDQVVAQNIALRAANCIVDAVGATLNAIKEPSSSQYNLGKEAPQAATVDHENMKSENGSKVTVSSTGAAEDHETSPIFGGVLKDADNCSAKSRNVPGSESQSSIQDGIIDVHAAINEAASTEMKTPEMEPETHHDDTVNSRQESIGLGRQKSGRGFWDLLFGDDTGEDAESSSSVESSKLLEDDYFRP